MDVASTLANSWVRVWNAASMMPGMVPGAEVLIDLRPDGVTSELFLLMDQDTESTLLEHYNTKWRAGQVPLGWKEAVVASTYEGKRADRSPANYRAISLLNSV